MNVPQQYATLRETPQVPDGPEEITESDWLTSAGDGQFPYPWAGTPSCWDAFEPQQYTRWTLPGIPRSEVRPQVCSAPALTLASDMFPETRSGVFESVNGWRQGQFQHGL
jgi:hypothetical protein